MPNIRGPAEYVFKEPKKHQKYIKNKVCTLFYSSVNIIEVKNYIYIWVKT